MNEVYEFETAYDELRREHAKKSPTQRRKTKSKLKLNEEKFNEVVAVARDAKAWMLKHLRRDMPRTDLQKRLIAKQRDRELWEYVGTSNVHLLKNRVKRLSKQQHNLIIQEMKKGVV